MITCALMSIFFNDIMPAQKNKELLTATYGNLIIKLPGKMLKQPLLLNVFKH
jgi:hypothetical protein